MEQTSLQQMSCCRYSKDDRHVVAPGQKQGEFSPTLVWGLIARVHEVQGGAQQMVWLLCIASPGETAGIFG